MSSPNDGYVAVKGGVRKPQKIQLETKEYFLYLGIGRILFTALMHGTVNRSFLVFEFKITIPDLPTQ